MESVTSVVNGREIWPGTPIAQNNLVVFLRHGAEENIWASEGGCNRRLGRQA